MWRHTRRGDKYVTVIIDLTPVRDRTGPARLLDMVEGRSKQVFKTWLSERDETWRAAVEVVAMDGFTGFKTAVVEELADDVTVVMDPFHVVRLGGQGLELCRRRVQQQTLGHRGRAGDPLYSARRALSTGADLLTDNQQQRISALFANKDHLEVEATWGVYQAMVDTYRDPDRASGKTKMQTLIDTLATGRPGNSAGDQNARPDVEATGRRRPGLLRPARHQQRTDRSDQRPPRAPPRIGSGLQKPDQLRRQITPGNRRIQTGTTPSIAMSPITASGNSSQLPTPPIANQPTSSTSRLSLGLTRVGGRRVRRLLPSGGGAVRTVPG